MTELSEQQINDCRWVLKALTVDCANGPTNSFRTKQPEWSNRVDALCDMALKQTSTPTIETK
jgi:hypothetical protein